MKKASSLATIWFALLALCTVPATAGDKNLGDAYALGVNMAFASYQSLVGSKAYGLTLIALDGAARNANALHIVASKLNVQDLSGIRQDLGETDDYAGTYSRIVALRGEYSTTLYQVSKKLGSAYDLGVAIGIAEAQATAGEPARQIVISSLVIAKSPAKRLGLDVTEIEAVLQPSGTTLPMPDIYQRIVSLRGRFQGQLN